MKNSVFAISLIALCLAGQMQVFASTEDRVEKRFAAVAGGKLVVEVDFGEVDVSAGESPEVAIDAWRKVTRPTKTAEEEFLKDRPIQITENDGTVSVRCKANSKLSWWRNYSKTEAKYTIRVPRNFNLELHTAGGPVKAKAVSGSVIAGTAGGNISLSGINGPVKANTAGGSINAESCQGDLRVDTSGGAIRVTGGGGTLNGKTAGGSVTVKEFKGPAKVSTSGGGIDVENVSGKIEGSTAGGSVEVSLSKPPSEDVRMSTSGGRISVRLPANSAFQLDAQTSAGSVSSELPITLTGKLNKSHVQGAVNGGGSLIHLRSSGGGIDIRKL